jgi:hypothetical protein
VEDRGGEPSDLWQRRREVDRGGEPADLWQGTTRATGLFFMAEPTALAAPGVPAHSPTWL